MDDGRIKLLQGMPIFGGIQPRTLEVLLDAVAPMQVVAAEYFFREGDPAEAMFVLEQGRVAVWKRWGDCDHRLRDLGAGDCFGEMAVIDLHSRSASVVALEDCTALRLTSAQLYRVCEANAEQFALLYMNIARELSRRLRTADDRLFQIGLESGRSGDRRDAYTSI